MIEGTWIRHAIHWASIPVPRISASVGPRVDSVAAHIAAVMWPTSRARLSSGDHGDDGVHSA
jgi:hypothetical protein